MSQSADDASTSSHAASVDAEEIARFSALAETWWDADGAMRPLHQLNPIRLGYIRDRLARLANRDPFVPRPLEGLRILDVGCGGGLICEPLCRLGGTVVGIDASTVNIKAARRHAAESALTIEYRAMSVESLAEGNETFDAVLALEIVEHVADLDSFLEACTHLVAPRGTFAGATLNRTPQSFALAIVGAEYLLRWLPRGTHSWSKFVRPSEFIGALRQQGLAVDDVTGVSYRPIAGVWTLSDDLSVNYMLAAQRGA